MRKKSEKITATQLTEIAVTVCLLTTLLTTTNAARGAELTQVNNNLQQIFSRIKQKYAEHDAQQKELAAQAEAAKIIPSSTSISQSIDVTTADINETPVSNDLYLSPTDSDSRFAAGEELILTTSINNLELASIFAFKTGQGLQIGLSDFLQIAELPIYADVETLSAEGWFQKESNKFTLVPLADGRLKVSVGSKNFFIAADNYRVEEDIFIELSEISRWFELEYQLNEERLALALTSKNKLPVELRLARLNKKSIATGINNESVLPLTDSDYRAFSPPMLDVQTWAQDVERVYPPLPSAPANEAPRKERQQSANYSILASHDLAYLNAELFLAGNKEDSLSNAWLTMSRQSDGSDLLGPLGATEYAFGDITPVNAGLGNTLSRNLGFSFGNTPINQLADNRRVNIVGELQVGWDVELYRNGVLIAQQLGVSSGRYEFNDTELEYGNNDFELLFYGPQGQIESKKESYIVDSNTVRGGEGMYRFSLVEVGQSVFNMENNIYDPTQEGLMASTVLDYGLNDWLAFSAGSSVFEPKIGDVQHFVNLGANASLGKAGLLGARFQQDKNQLNSTFVDYRTRLLDTSYSASFLRQENKTFASDAIYTTDTLNATMAGQLLSGTRFPLSYQNAWQRREQEGLNTRDESFQNSIGVNTRLGYFSNTLILQKDAFTTALLDPTIDPLLNPAVTEDSLRGSLNYRKGFGRLHTRLYSDYSVNPTNEVYAYGGAFNYSWSASLNSELRYANYTLADRSQVNLSLNWRKDAFYLNTNAGYTDDGSWSAGIGLRFSLGYEPTGNSVFTSGRPIAQSGAVSARVFEDLNMNGIFDTNERPIENATVKAVQAYRQQKTNSQGVAVLSSLYNNTITDIVVDESTLDGPFMINAIPGVAIKARKGFVESIDLPVVKAGEVEGIIYLKDASGTSSPAPYIMLNLLDKADKIVASTRSEFDGYYLFTNVKPGHYRLQVDESYIDRRGLKEANKRLDFSSDGDVIAGVDFVLRPLDEASGYVASAGHFKTPNLLKLYYHILRNKLGGQFIQTPFYIKQADKKGYILGLAYFAGDPVTGVEAKQKAQDACTALAKYDMYCDVQYHDFKY